MNEASTQDPNSKNSSNHTGQSESKPDLGNTLDPNEMIKSCGGQPSILEPVGVEANPNYIDSLLVLTKHKSIEAPSELPFIVQVERINEILLRVITGKIDGQHPAFDVQKMMVHMADMSKYTAFKKLVSQTAHVLKTRTSHYPSLVKTMSKPQTEEVVPREIAMDEEEEDNSGPKKSKKEDNSDEFFNEGLRIIMYDKIIKSGFNHLSIFLDDFNYIYNEVITSTNHDLGEGNFAPDKLDLQAGQLLFNEFPKPSVLNARQEVQSSGNQSETQQSGSFVNYYQDFFGRHNHGALSPGLSNFMN